MLEKEEAGIMLLIIERVLQVCLMVACTVNMIYYRSKSTPCL